MAPMMMLSLNWFVAAASVMLVGLTAVGQIHCALWWKRVTYAVYS